MSAIYGFASRLSGCLAGLCAILALLALPSGAQADTASDCTACCQSKGFTDQQLSECVGFCMQGSGPCALAGQCPSKADAKGKCDGCVAPGKQCEISPGNPGLCTPTANKCCNCE